MSIPIYLPLWWPNAALCYLPCLFCIADFSSGSLLMRVWRNSRREAISHEFGYSGNVRWAWDLQWLSIFYRSNSGCQDVKLETKEDRDEIDVYNVHVSNELGAGNPKSTAFSVLVVTLMTFIISVIIVVIIRCARDYISYIFTDGERVVDVVPDLCPLLAITIILNGIQLVLPGVAIGCVCGICQCQMLLHYRCSWQCPPWLQVWFWPWSKGRLVPFLFFEGVVRLLISCLVGLALVSCCCSAVVHQFAMILLDCLYGWLLPIFCS